jgi:hypothetical protein
VEKHALGRIENRVVALLLVFGLHGALANDHSVTFGSGDQ